MARFITALDDMELSGEAADGEEALRLCARSHPDVVLMAVIMPGMPAVEIIRAIRQQWPPTRVLGMSTFQQEERVSEVLRAGAVGYLLKNVSAEELARTIRRACAA
jgi:NarL family two-component system response regulator LiaR